jgi:hypothetical protein
MTMLRVGGSHRTNLRVRNRLSSMKRESVIQPTSSGLRVWSYTEIMTMIDPLLRTPVLRSLLSLLLRSIPLADESDAFDSISSGIAKELQTTQQTTKHATLCYPFLTDLATSISMPMHPDLPFRPFLSAAIYHRLLRWKERLRNKLLLPQCSFKSVGDISRDNLLHMAHVNFTEGFKQPVSTADLERFYAETGQRVSGPCEVRMAWKYNDLKPRIYYAIGADAYFAARYTWEIFDSLQRSFKCSDPRTRYQFHRFPMIDFDQEVFMIYDYASFTSNLADFPRFVAELGVFLKGTGARLFDTHRGIVEIDLSHLLDTYNNICNIEGEFDISKVVHLEDGSSRLILNHHVAGMLGVYSNITGSTALHGLVGMTIAGTEDRINTIGDDASGVFDTSRMSIDETKDCIRIIGDIAEDKFEVWTEDQCTEEDGIGWHYTKRPLNIEYGVVDTGWMPDFPIYPVLLSECDRVHTVQEKKFDERRRIAILQSIRLLESMRSHVGLIDDTDIQIVLEFLTWLYGLLRIPVNGSLPSRSYHSIASRTSYPDKFLASPVLVEESITVGWWKTLTETMQSDTGYLTLPVCEDDRYVPEVMMAGQEFTARGSKIFGILEKIGVLSKEQMIEEVLVTEESLERMEQIMIGELHSSYRYTVLQDYPQWTSYFLTRYLP